MPDPDDLERRAMEWLDVQDLPQRYRGEEYGLAALLRDVCKERDERIAVLEAVAKTTGQLADRLDEIVANASYQAQVTIAWAHGHRYDVPSWTAEIAHVRRDLAALDGDKEGR